MRLRKIRRGAILQCGLLAFNTPPHSPTPHCVHFPEQPLLEAPPSPGERVQWLEEEGGLRDVYDWGGNGQSSGWEG